MEIYTLDTNFKRIYTLDKYISAIWTERYYGNGDFEISVPTEMLTLLPKGQILMCEGSDEPMILETRDIENGILKVTGINLVQWLNNRIIRTSDDPKVRDWQLVSRPAQAMVAIVESMCVASDWISGTIPIGIPASITALFPVPGLQTTTLDVPDTEVNFSIPFGPVYDALKQIAETYEIGQTIKLSFVAGDFVLTYEAYRGEDRTSAQSVNPVVQFSDAMDSFTNIHDLESISDHKNYVAMFLGNPSDTYAAGPGLADALPAATPGFDLRFEQTWSDSIDPTGLTDADILNILNQQATKELSARKVVQLVDGQIVQAEGVVYGTNFFLGDLVEVVGNTGVKQTARITEYIRSQDAAGEKSYPGLTFLD